MSLQEHDPAKLVFAGPVGAGKTTFIRSLADDEPISTEMPLTGPIVGNKTTTTVALDFATAILDDGTPLFLYGLPGQEHFAFMRNIVLEGALGALVLLNGSEDDVAEQCHAWLDSIHGINPQLPVAIGITHTDKVPAFSMARIRQIVRDRGILTPVFTIDARNRAHAAQLVRSLLVSAS